MAESLDDGLIFLSQRTSESGDSARDCPNRKFLMVSIGKLSTPILLRFCDTDMIGHINNVAFAAFAESGRIDLFRKYGFVGANLILVRLAVDFKAQLQLEDATHIESWVDRVGNSSITVKQQVIGAKKVVAEVESVVVTFDYASNEPRNVPEELRRQIAELNLSDIHA